MKKTKRLDNQGFSLIELMIVVAIIIVVTGAFAIGYSLISTKAVDQCAKKMQISIEGTRNTTMGKLSASVSFYTSGGKIMVDKEINGEHNISEIGGKDVVVKYVLTDGVSADPATLLTSTHLTMSFNRASGSLLPYSGSKYVGEFIVSNKKGSKTLHIKIDKLTGRVTVE